jgi:hypothetical protein
MDLHINIFLRGGRSRLESSESLKNWKAFLVWENRREGWREGWMRGRKDNRMDGRDICMNRGPGQRLEQKEGQV